MYPQAQKTVHRLLSDNKAEEMGLPLSDLAVLKGSDQVALAFDGVKVLDDITQTVREENPMAVYTSSAPLNVYREIDKFFEIKTALESYFQSINKTFKPVFVFNGCAFKPLPDINAQPPAAINSVIAQLNAALPIEHFDSNIFSKAVLKSCADRFNIEEDLEALIIRRIHEASRDTFRAPYLAWSQISSFLEASNNYVSEVCGHIELLAFPGVERVITKIDIQNGTFNCITKAAALKAVRLRIPQLSEEDFSALLLLESKCKGFCVTLPHGTPTIFEDYARSPNDANVNRTQRFLTSVRFLPETMQCFRRNLAALEAPVMTNNGNCVLLCEAYGRPKTITVKEFFGARQPPVLYYCLFSGVTMPTPYTVLGQSCFVEDWPLVDTAFFRGACERILPLRAQASFQFFQFTGGFANAQLRWLRQFLIFRSKGSSVCWCDIQNPPQVVLSNWLVNPNMLIRNEDGNVYFTDVLPFAECAIRERFVAEDVLTTLTVILLKSLDLIGYFTHSAPHEEEISGMCSLSAGLQMFDCPTLSEYGVLLIELVRTQILHDLPIDLTPGPAGTQPFAAPFGARFAARAVSIIPINIDDPWTGPFDPEIAAFGAASRLLGRSLRLITEVNAAVVFASGCTSIPLSEFDQVVQMLPYSIPVEFNAGFLMMHILVNPDCTLESLSHNFPDLPNLAEDLGTLFWFWSMAVRALSYILIQEKGDKSFMEPTILLAAHDLMNAACSRLCPNHWHSYYAGLRSCTDLVIHVFGLFAPNPMMQHPQQRRQQPVYGGRDGYQ